MDSRTSGTGLTRVGNTMMKITHHDGTAFERFAQDWRELEIRNAGPDALFAGYRFCTAIRPHLDPAEEPFILTAHEGDRLRAIWPLTRRRERLWTVLRSFGHPVPQTASVLIDAGISDPQAVAQSFLHHIRKSELADAAELVPAFASSGLVRLPDEIPLDEVADGTMLAPMVDLRRWRDDWTGPAPISKKMRKELARKRRQLEELGPVEARFARDGAERLALLETVLAWKKEWLRARGLVSLALDSASTRRMLEAFAGDPASPMIISVLTVDHTPVAVELGFTDSRYCFAYLASYAPELQAHGPGSVLIADTLSMLAGQGVEFYDLMQPVEGYKRIWSHIARPVADCSQVFSFRGQMFRSMSSAAVRELARTAWHALPHTIRQPIARRINR